MSEETQTPAAERFVICKYTEWGQSVVISERHPQLPPIDTLAVGDELLIGNGPANKPWVITYLGPYDFPIIPRQYQMHTDTFEDKPLFLLPHDVKVVKP